MLSVIIPAYNEEPMITIAVEKISSILLENKINYELILIDDGSSDLTWEKIKIVSKSEKFLKGIHFSRHFGKEAAMMAGLSYSSGDCCVIIDCDLQQPPEKIIEMYRLWETGYEIIEGVINKRKKEGIFRKFSSRFFYLTIGRIFGLNLSGLSDFKLLDRKVVDILTAWHEKNTFFRALTVWMGFKTTSITYDYKERIAGETKWSNTSLIKYAIRNITSFTMMPMYIVTVCGLVLLLFLVIICCKLIIDYNTDTVFDWNMFFNILQLISNSIIMISIGIIGYYIARILEEVRNRPKYIISEQCGRKSCDDQ
ncbi:MAG: glycosyltransferase family 2 protein [Merdibacter sp.]|nr:glycosyltransferase family 2 protein [Merdibacter sp.]